MSEWSGFFNAKKVDGAWDRTYLAENFASFFAPLIKNGVFAGKSDSLQVIPTSPTSMSIQVSKGQAWLSGYSYINDDFLEISIDPADGSLNRIDSIILQWSSADRKISVICRKGTAATSPSAPTLQTDSGIRELCLAEINVLAGLTSVKEQHIRDTRADTSLCGWVTGLIDQVDTSTLFKQWEAAYLEQYNQNITYLEQQKASWEEFFSNIQDDTVLPIPSAEKAGNSIVVNSAGSGYELKLLYESKSVTLLKNGWSSNQQTVTVNLTAQDNLIVAPTDSSRKAYINSDVYCKQQLENQLVFSCESVPEVDLTVGVLIIKS